MIVLRKLSNEQLVSMLDLCKRSIETIEMLLSISEVGKRIDGKKIAELQSKLEIRKKIYNDSFNELSSYKKSIRIIKEILKERGIEHE